MARFAPELSAPPTGPPRHLLPEIRSTGLFYSRLNRRNEVPGFNMQQLATKDQAAQLALLLDTYNIGEGVDEIYIPDFLLSKTPEETVNGVVYEWLHFRFNNGAEGINVGLILDMLKRNSNRAYVLSILQRDIASQV